jgi:hypothetical protein
VWRRVREEGLCSVTALQERVLHDPAALERLLPEVGLADLFTTIYPPELQSYLGQGLQCLQWPNQLAPYLVTLSRYPIRRYLEIGVLRGGTFMTTVEYLDRFHPLERAWGVDLFHSVPVYRYLPRQRKARMVRTRSGTPEFRRKVEQWRPDLVLIDADHSYAAVRADFESVHGVANMVAFHDITDSASPGVTKLWAELREQHGDVYDFVDFTEQYGEVTDRIGGTLLGIGLAVRKDFGPPLTGV